LTLRYVLEAFALFRAKGGKFSEFVAPYQKYYQAEDVIVDVDNKKKAQATVEAFLKAKKPVKTRKFDGVWVDFGDVWGSVKISVTEHALKMMFEGTSKKVVTAFQKEVVEFVKGIAKD
jgi:phosphomannomutase